MKLFLLRRIEYRDWGKLMGCVVRAQDEAQARQVTAESYPVCWTGDDAMDASDFLDPALVSCTEISVEGEAQVIITDAWEP